MKKYKDCSNYFFKKAIEEINALQESDNVFGYEKELFDSILQDYFAKYHNRKSINIFLYSIKKDFLFKSSISKFENIDYLKIYNIANSIFFCGLGRADANKSIKELLHLPNQIELDELIEFLIKLYKTNPHVRDISGFTLREKLDLTRISLEIKIFEKYKNRFILRGKIFNLPGLRKEILNKIKSVIEIKSKYSILAFIYKLIYEYYYDKELNYFISKSDLIEGGLVYFYHLCLAMAPEKGEEFNKKDFNEIQDSLVALLGSYAYLRDSQFDGMFFHDPYTYLIRIIKHDFIYCYNQYNPDAFIFLTYRIFKNEVENIKEKAFCFYILNNLSHASKFINVNNLALVRERFYNYISSMPESEKNEICRYLMIDPPGEISRGFCDDFLSECSIKIKTREKILPHNIRSPINELPSIVIRGDSDFPYLKYLGGNLTANSFFEENYKELLYRDIGKDFEMAFHQLFNKFSKKVINGHYKLDKKNFEVDAILETKEYLINFELKVKPITRESRKGNYGSLVSDLILSLLQACVQSLRFRILLMTKKKVELFNEIKDLHSNTNPYVIHYDTKARYITCCIVPLPIDSLTSPVVVSNLIQMFIQYEFSFDEGINDSVKLHKVQKEFRGLTQQFYSLLGEKDKEDWMQELMLSIKFISFEKVYLFVRHASSYDEFIKLFSGTFNFQSGNYRLYDKIREAIKLLEYRKNNLRRS